MECVPIISFLFYLFRHLLILFSSFLSHLFLTSSTSIFPSSLPSFVTFSHIVFWVFLSDCFLSFSLTLFSEFFSNCFLSFSQIVFWVFLSHCFLSFSLIKMLAEDWRYQTDKRNAILFQQLWIIVIEILHFF